MTDPVKDVIGQFEECMRCWVQRWGMVTCIKDWSDPIATPNAANFIQKFSADPKRIKALYCLHRCSRRRLCIDEILKHVGNDIIEALDIAIKKCDQQVGKEDEFKGFFDTQ